MEQQDSVIVALTEQLECYRKLARLAQQQHINVQQGQTEQLLDVLRKRQDVLEEAMQHEATISPAKKRWAQYLTEIPAGLRQKAEQLLAETGRLLETITTADRNDAMVLQQRKINLGRQIQLVTSARSVNRKYAAAAYGTPKSKVDLQR